jgi:hypothetical protein
MVWVLVIGVALALFVGTWIHTALHQGEEGSAARRFRWVDGQGNEAKYVETSLALRSPVMADGRLMTEVSASTRRSGLHGEIVAYDFVDGVATRAWLFPSNAQLCATLASAAAPDGTTGLLYSVGNDSLDLGVAILGPDGFLSSPQVVSTDVRLYDGRMLWVQDRFVALAIGENRVYRIEVFTNGKVTTRDATETYCRTGPCVVHGVEVDRGGIHVIMEEGSQRFSSIYQDGSREDWDGWDRPYLVPGQQYSVEPYMWSQYANENGVIVDDTNHYVRLTAEGRGVSVPVAHDPDCDYRSSFTLDRGQETWVVTLTGGCFLTVDRELRRLDALDLFEHLEQRRQLQGGKLGFAKAQWLWGWLALGPVVLLLIVLLGRLTFRLRNRRRYSIDKPDLWRPYLLAAVIYLIVSVPLALEIWPLF